MAYTPYYSPYPQTSGGYYTAPMPDQLTQLRQPYQQPVQQPQVMPQPIPQTQPVTQNGIVWVPNETAAREYLVAPNSAVAMWDSSAPVVYLKQADASGKPTLKTYDLVERPTEAHTRQICAETVNMDYVTREEFMRLEARLDALTRDGQPAPRETVKQKKTGREETD